MDLEQVTAERDLFLRLLDLGHQLDIASFLSEALGLIVQSSGVQRGYLELYDDSGGAPDQPWSTARGFSAEEVRNVRAALSRAIIAQALATGETIVTDCAWLDPRFSERQSVQVGKIEAVLCAPIGSPPRGVLYLQGGEGRGLFSEEQRERTQTVVRHLVPLVERLVGSQRDQRRTDHTRALRQRMRLDGVVGSSAALAAALREIELVAAMDDVPVFLKGETGTGKTALARILHVNSRRATHPFVELNCATFQDTLVESELFGSVPGAHSTATRKIVGKVEAAESGTLLLDEIAELSPAVQAKLLQLLESKQYYPLGSAQAVRANVRVVAATNSDLKLAVTEKRFREDLYHRLQGFPIRVPSLTERREDIPELAAYFCRTFCERNGLPRLDLSPAAISALESAEWPGNVRDLDRQVQHGVIRASGEGARQLERGHLFPAEAELPSERPLTFQEATRQFQAELVLAALEECGWNVVDCARRLDLTRSHVYNLINAFGLSRSRR